MSVKILKSTFTISSPSLKLCPLADRWEYAFIGRSNVWKSSLINTICAKRELAKTSPKPGKTQLINYFAIESEQKLDEETPQHTETNPQSWYLVDLPWYGYARISKNERQKWEVMIEDYILRRSSLKHMFVLIDSRHKPQKLDIDFVKRLSDASRPFSLVFTKIDATTQKEVAANVKLFLAEISKLTPIQPAYFTTSSTKPWSVQKIIQTIHEMNE